MLLIVEDHRCLMQEEVDVMNAVNAELPEGVKHFHIVSDL